MKKFLLVFFSFVFALSAWAQERVVSGKVTSVEDGSPYPGVNVVVKGTTNGTATDADGKYSITVSGPTTLVFSFIGLKSSEIVVGERTVVDIQMEAETTQLSEVVVTALNITQEAKVLPYAAQVVSAEKLNMTRANNVVDALAGKVAGIQVRSQAGSALGRAADIRIRGSVGGNDQGPLYVLDGVPLASANGATSISPSADINPDDIESTTVLKGPAATALYGQRGDAGVIIMTSKRAKKGAGLGIDVSHTTFADKVYILQRDQNTYSGGAFADLQKFTYQPGMPAGWAALNGKYFPDYTDDGSWGPRMVGQEYIPWYAYAPGTKYSFQTAKLTPQPNNIRKFYNTGLNNITNISIGKADENYSVRFSYTNQNQTGIQPNSRLDKNTFSTQASINLSPLVTVGTNINYTQQSVNGNFDDGYANQTAGSFNQWFHRDLDMNILKELSNETVNGRYVSWNHFNPSAYLTQGDGFYRGFYWWNHKTYVDNISFKSNRSRLFGDINLRLNLHKNFSIFGAYQTNTNWNYSENKQPQILENSFYVELRPTGQAPYAYYGTQQFQQKEDNMNVLGTYNNKFLDNKLSVTVNGGGNIRSENFVQFNANTNYGLIVPDLFTLSNSKQLISYGNARVKKTVRSVYAHGNFGIADMLFLDWSVRNDWSSALPVKKNSYLYPSVGASFVFSELTSATIPVLSFGKLRAGWAQTGSDPSAYQLGLLYGLQTYQWNGNGIIGTPNQLVDPNIQPAISSSFEVGTDLKFLENRVGLSVTYYNRTKTKEILPVQVTNSTGFTTTLINAGKFQNTGIEVQINATPVQTGDFRWTVDLNLAHQVSKVLALVPGINSQVQSAVNGNGVNDAFGTVRVVNTVGEKWGQLRGFGIEKKNGTPVLDGSGFYIPIQNQDLGSILPDFTGGIQNRLTYKSWAVAFNIDFQKGGKFFSLSDWFGTFSGLTKRTAQINDKGVAERDPVGDGGGVHVTGVNESGAPVNTYVDGKLYYQQFVNSSIAENSIYDLTFVKLRELSISYQIPVKKLGAVGNKLRNASVSLVGRNLWMIYSQCKDYDPSQISGVYGENGQLPGTRSLGFQLKLGL